MRTCLITGGAGNLGCQLGRVLSGRYDRIVLADVVPAPVGDIPQGACFEPGDLTDPAQLDGLFRRHRPVAVVHLASLLSSSCEQDRVRAWRVNAEGTFLLLEAALRHGPVSVLFASSVAAFGGGLPNVITEDTPQWPDGLYGVTKMAAERLGVYYQRRHQLDFRCLRLPVTISRHAPAGAASAQASHAFLAAEEGRDFSFRAWPDTPMALIYIRDVLRALTDLLKSPVDRLTRRVYNLHSMTATPRDIAAAIRRRLPQARIGFQPEPATAALLASWPARIDDEAARRDWNWRPEFDLESTAEDFFGAKRPCAAG